MSKIVGYFALTNEQTKALRSGDDETFSSIFGHALKVAKGQWRNFHKPTAKAPFGQGRFYDNREPVKRYALTFFEKDFSDMNALEEIVAEKLQNLGEPFCPVARQPRRTSAKKNPVVKRSGKILVPKVPKKTEYKYCLSITELFFVMNNFNFQNIKAGVSRDDLYGYEEFTFDLPEDLRTIYSTDSGEFTESQIESEFIRLVEAWDSFDEFCPTIFLLEDDISKKRPETILASFRTVYRNMRKKGETWKQVFKPKDLKDVKFCFKFPLPFLKNPVSSVGFMEQAFGHFLGKYCPNEFDRENLPLLDTRDGKKNFADFVVHLCTSQLFDWAERGERKVKPVIFSFRFSEKRTEDKVASELEEWIAYSSETMLTRNYTRRVSEVVSKLEDIPIFGNLNWAGVEDFLMGAVSGFFNKQKISSEIFEKF